MTRGLESSLEAALESVGQPILGWVGFIGGGCGEDSQVFEVIVFKRVGGVRYVNVCVSVCVRYVRGGYVQFFLCVSKGQNM
jgi:hypothetical protein